MNFFTRILGAFILSLALAGCGGSAEIGEACDTSGAVDECVDGAICTNGAGETNACRKSCVEQTDCAATESCNGISGSNVKSCQPS